MSIKYLKAICVIILTFNPFTFPGIALGQIAPDNSLGSERSRVTTKNNNQEITGGARRGNNLFHSFKEFGIPEGRSAYFIPPGNIANIFSRVTGKNLSNIQGILGVRGNANLFLLNPNGIIFGKNAQLDLKGSFMGSTGESFLFSDGSQFSATNPQGVPILTVNVVQPIGIKFGNQPGLILNQSQPGLKVEPNQTLGLLGGGIQIEQGNISAPSSQIILGAVGSNNTINLTEISTGSYQVSYLGVKEFGDLSLSGGSKVYTNGSGSIEIQGKKISLTDSSQIYSISGDETAGNISLKATDISLTGIETNIYSQSSGKGVGADIAVETENLIITEGGQIYANIKGTGKGGNLFLKATNSLELTNANFDQQNKVYESGIRSVVLKLATGNAGDINIETDKLLLSSGGRIFASTFGQGNAGALNVNATQEIKITGAAFDSQGVPTFSRLWGRVQPGASGTGGNITIDTAKLMISEGGAINSSTVGTGRSGLLGIKAAEEVNISGVVFDSLGIPYISGIFAVVNSGVSVKGGDIKIDTNKLTLSRGGQISVSTQGIADAGSMTLNAQEFKATGVLFSNTGTPFISGLFARVSAEASGKGGNITIDTEKLQVLNGAQISASTFGRGDAGSLTVNATQEIILKGVAFNETQTQGVASSLVAVVQGGATGKGGNITIDTQKLQILKGAQISASTFGMGNAGSINVTADEEVKINGVVFGTINRPSSILARVQPGASGTGGNITIDTKKLQVLNGGQISASTIGQGDAGLMALNASQEVRVKGVVFDSLGNAFRSGLYAEVNSGASGNGGNLIIDTNKLLVSSGSQISVSTFSLGNGGNVRINATESVEVSGVVFGNDGRPRNSGVFARVYPAASGNGGDITINTGKLLLSGGGEIAASTFGTGDAGNMRINATEELRISGIAFDSNGKSYRSGLVAKVEPKALGNGGNLIVNTANLFIYDRGQISTESKSIDGQPGNINITASEISLDDKALILTNTQQGDGGNITITASDLLLLRRESNISATAGNEENGGDGGNINLDAKFIVANSFENSNITANAFSGTGGTVTINSKGLFGIEANSVDTPVTSDITASSANGPQGTVIINNPNVQPRTGIINLTAQPITYRFVRLCENRTDSPTLEFYFAGRGGQLPTPEDFLTPNFVTNPWLDLLTLNNSDNLSSETKASLDFDSMALFLPCE